MGYGNVPLPPIFTNTVTYDPSFTGFDPYSPTIHRAIAVPDVASGRIEDLRFLAFSRDPYTNEERERLDPRFAPEYIDRNILYRVFVTDDFTLLGEFTPDGIWMSGDLVEQGMFLHEASASMMTLHPHTETVGSVSSVVPQYHWPAGLPLAHFYTRTENGGIERLPLQGNRSYNIMIYAIRTNPDGSIREDHTGEFISLPAFYRVFMPPFGPLELHPEMIARPPLRVLRDHEDFGPNSIPIAWDLRYFEIAEFNPDTGNDTWHGIVGVNNGEVLYGRVAVHTPNVDRLSTINCILRDHTSPDVRNILTRLNADNFNPANALQVGIILHEVAVVVRDWLGDAWTEPFLPPLRLQDMGTAENPRRDFAIHTVPLNLLMDSTIGTPPIPGGTLGSAYEMYRLHELWTNPDGTGGADMNAWRPLPWSSLEVINGVVHYTVRRTENPGGGIEDNTAYVIYVMPYEVFQHGSGRQWIAYLPSYVIVTTPDDRDREVAPPTVPVLHPYLGERFTTRTSVGVRWRVQGRVCPDTGLPIDIFTDLHWSESWLDHPDGGTTVYWEDIAEAILDRNDPSRIAPYPNPDSPLYIFYRIPGLFVDTMHFVWATAFNADGVEAPAPSNPANIRTLNIEPPLPPRALGRASDALLTTFNRVNGTEYNNRDAEALHISFLRGWDDLDSSIPSPERASAADVRGGSASMLNLPLPQFYAQHLLRLTDLRSNTGYYVRARTILTVRRGGVGGEVREVFSYEIQVSLDPYNFLDAVTIFIPATEIIPAGYANARQVFSEWVVTPPLRTGEDDEYDIHRPELFPLPDRDFEITYDPGSQTLNWRFRTNQIGADGHRDQNVDQRFLSRLSSERVFVYTVDMSEYRNMPIANRNLIIPMSIIRGFNVHGVTLVIDAGDIIYRIPPGTFDTAEFRGVQPGVGTYVHITLNSNPSGMPGIMANASYAIPPQRLSVTAHTPSRSLSLSSFARPMDIILPMDSHVSPLGANTALFQAGTGIQGWQDMQGNFSFAANSLHAQTSQPGTFTGITRVAPQTTGPVTPAVDTAMQRVTSRITITDLHTFNAGQEVAANAFNNIVNAVVHGNTTVTMGAGIPQAESQALSRRGFLVGDGFTREEAINILVQVYALRTGQLLTPMSPADSIPGLANANPDFHRNLRIAADIGFITGPLIPQGSLTMGELMNMLDILLMDAGW
jgi:peptidoglycan hydrolase-like protein with peptidoglycan-binding domain